MKTETTEYLAYPLPSETLLVSFSGFKWKPGMRLVAPSGNTYIVVRLREDGWVYLAPEAEGSALGWYNPVGCFPSLSHPGTVGWVRKLVDDLYGGGVIVSCTSDIEGLDPDEWSVRVKARHGSHLKGWGPTRAEALVSAVIGSMSAADLAVFKSGVGDSASLPTRSSLTRGAPV